MMRVSTLRCTGGSPRRAKVAGDRGEPEATGPVILELVDMTDPPLRLFLGNGPLEIIEAECAKRLAEWREYAELSRSAHRSMS